MDVSALLPTANSSVSSTMLSILYGGGATGTASPGSAVAALASAVKTEAKGVAAAAKEPETKRDIAAFRAAVAKAKDAKSLLADPAFRKVLLTANGLADQIGYGALATKALLSDTARSDSLAAKLADTRWLAAAKTFDFANKGLSVIKDPAVLNRLADGYAEMAWRKSLDAATPGLSNALDFRERASSITSVDQILGDSALRKVVTTALGIPQEIAYQTLEAQEHAISSRLDIAQLRKPAFVEQFTRRYLVAAATDAGSNQAQSAGLVL